MDRDKSKGGSNIWSTLLSDASASTATSVFSSDKSIIVLGDDLSGKSVLVTKLQGLDDPHRGSALDFQVINVQDEEIDENGVCRLWIIDGHLAYRSLLQYALPQNMLPHSLLLITVDMSQPWNIPETLEKWTRVLYEHVENLKLPIPEFNQMKEKLIEEFLSYSDPGDSKTDGKLSISKSVENSAQIDREQLDSLTLSSNIGLPLIVVCTKCDYFESLETEYDFREEHFDFIQHYLRLYCLKHGAGLVFTSMKENKNIELLKKYILHKLYGFPFYATASVVDRDAVFVPIGWDSEKKISIIQDSLSKFSVSDPFNSVISRPATTRIFSHDIKELQAEEEQGFLARAQTVLSKTPTVTKSVGSESVHSKMRPSQEGRPSFSPVAGKGKTDPIKGGANNERMLANFFNSLLSKKPGNSPNTTAKSGRKNPDPSVQQRNNDS